MKDRKKIKIKAFAKINLALDVEGVREDGMHIVNMIMQQISLWDDVSMEWIPAEEASEGKGAEINLTTDNEALPADERNLAYKAALLMRDYCDDHIIDGRKCLPRGKLNIHIKKKIPIAAGLAGGSGNGGAVIHGLNVLWNLNLSLKELCELGARLGSDVPFTVMGQAAANKNLKERFAGDPLACHCALATGTGTELKPISGLKSYIVLSKPPISVSTAEVYKGIDSVPIPERPDTLAMVEGLKENNIKLIGKNMVNVLENYTLKEYSTVAYTKHKMQEFCKSGAVLMSGSGPTVFALCDSMKQAIELCNEMKKENRESFRTRTTI